MVLDTMADFQSWLMSAWEWLNAPLPVVGVSTIILCGFAIKLFASTSFGKKNIKKLNEGFTRVGNEINAFTEKTDQHLLDFENSLQEQIVSQKEEINFYKSKIIEICEVVRNSKLKEIAKEIMEYDGSRTNDTETQEGQETIND